MNVCVQNISILFFEPQPRQDAPLAAGSSSSGPQVSLLSSNAAAPSSSSGPQVPLLLSNVPFPYAYTVVYVMTSSYSSTQIISLLHYVSFQVVAAPVLLPANGHANDDDDEKVRIASTDTTW